MVGEYRFLLHRLCQRAQCKLAYKLPSAAFLLQRYAFLLKDARNYWKMFEGEEDKKKKVYPACPMYEARRIHLNYIYERYMSDCLLYNLHGIVSTLQDKQAIARNIVLLELRGLHLAYQLAFGIIYIGIRRRCNITI